MKDRINKELTKLQKELGTLNNAVSQIAKAEKISTELVKSVQDLNGKYNIQFEKIIKQFDTYLNESKKQTEKLLIDSISGQQKHLDESKKILTELKSEIKKLLTETQKNTKKLIEQHTAQVSGINKLLKSYLELAQSTAKLIEQIAEAVANLYKKRKKLEDVWASLSPTDKGLVNPPDTK